MDIISHEFETTQCIQVFHLNIIKEDLKNTALLHLDFSESQKKCQPRQDPESSLWAIFIFYFYSMCLTKNGEIRTIPVTVTTESNEHSCVTALSCIHKIISHIEEKVGVFTKFYIWSDGLASQFRSRFIFSFLSIFHLEKETE